MFNIGPGLETLQSLVQYVALKDQEMGIREVGRVSWRLRNMLEKEQVPY